MFAGLWVPLRFGIIERFLVGAEHDEPGVFGGLTVSEFENEDIEDCKVREVELVQDEEMDGAIGRV